MTPLMLAKSWNVTSAIRDPRQAKKILGLGKDQKGGQIASRLYDLETIKNTEDSQRVLDEVKLDYVVFAAGGSDSKSLYAVDRDAAKRCIKACTATTSVTKFFMISFPGARRNRAPWWGDREWKQFVDKKTMFPHQVNSKLEADAYLVAMAHAREQGGGAPFQAISLRPIWLTNGRATGKVQLGQVSLAGQVSRADVAAVAVALLERDDTRGWFDLLQGQDDIEEAVRKVVENGINCIDGENLEAMYAMID